MAESLKYLYGKYFQKSLNYLFPLLGMKREDLFVPAGTYMWWNGEESIDDGRLIVAYEKRDPALFGPFEKKVLLGNPYFESCYEVEDGKVYIFDLSSHGDTVKRFMKGRYSKFSEGVKKRIMTYHGCSADELVRPGRYLHMSLYPKLYYEKVAEELNGYPVEILEEGEELMDPPDVAKETLQIKIIGKCEKNPKKRISSGK